MALWSPHHLFRDMGTHRMMVQYIRSNGPGKTYRWVLEKLVSQYHSFNMGCSREKIRLSIWNRYIISSGGSENRTHLFASENWKLWNMYQFFNSEYTKKHFSWLEEVAPGHFFQATSWSGQPERSSGPLVSGHRIYLRTRPSIAKWEKPE